MKNLLMSVVVIALLVSCGNAGNNGNAGVEIEEGKLNVLSFHGKKRCITCNAIEDLTREVVAELGNQDIVLKVIDIDENEELSNRYEVAFSSLILVDGERVVNLTEMAFAHAKNEPEVFKAKLKEELAKFQ